MWINCIYIISMTLNSEWINNLKENIAFFEVFVVLTGADNGLCDQRWQLLNFLGKFI
jgi:hypothetical protein